MKTKIVENTGKRKPPRAGMGRPKGSPNRTTAALKEAVLATFDRLGGERFLEDLAKAKPEVFVSLLSKLIPSELKAEVSGSLSLETMVLKNALPWDDERLAYYAGQHDETMIFDSSGKALGILIPLNELEPEPLPAPNP